MEATMLLCDFAESVNGKLYVMGGGWTGVVGAAPINCAVAVKLDVPWTQTNQRHHLLLQLLHEDGEVATNPAANDDPVRIEGEFEVGRPPGARPGDPMTNTMAFQLQGLLLPSGGFRFSFSVNGTELAHTLFRVHRPPEAR